MKIRVFLSLLLAVASLSLFAEPPVRRTVIIKDGEMIVDGKRVELNERVFGGKHAWLGVTLIDLTPELRVHYGGTKESGVLIGSVAPQSPASKAGLKVGDVVLSIDGKDVDSPGAIRRQLREKNEGDTVRVELLRDHSRQTVVASVVEREGVRVAMPEIEELTTRLNSPEWRARLERVGPDCKKIEARIRELEIRLKDLDKKLQK